MSRKGNARANRSFGALLELFDNINEPLTHAPGNVHGTLS